MTSGDTSSPALDDQYERWRDSVSIDISGEAGSASGEPPLFAEIPATYLRRAVLDHLEGRKRIFSGFRLTGTVITGDVHLENLEISFPFFFDRCTFTGTFYAWGGRIRTLSFIGSILHRGADLRNSHINGNLLMRGDFVSLGPLILRDMTITGTTDLRGAQLLFDGSDDGPLTQAAEGECFGFSRSVTTAFFWGTRSVESRERTLADERDRRPRGVVTLRDVKTRSFRHDMGAHGLAAWPEPGKLIIEGFVYDRMDKCARQTVLNWIDLQLEKSPSAYFALANALAREGDKEDAEKIRSQIKREEIKKYRWWRKWPIRLSYLAIDYGASPLRALSLMILLFFLFLGSVWALKQNALMAPAVDGILLETCYYGPDKPCEKVITNWRKVAIGAKPVKRFVPPDYPDFSPVEYSLESFVPVLDFGQKRYWEPVSSPIRIGLATISLLGLFLGSLFLAAISGILSPRER